MRQNQLAAQLYTLREHTKTVPDLARSLRRVREIGFPAVQVSGVAAPLTAQEFKTLLEDTGLICCATHEPASMILDEPERVAERLHALGCRDVALPYPSEIALSTSADVSAFAARLNEAGRVLRGAGCRLTYHNHAIEMARVQGKTILDTLLDETEPHNLQAEIDVYWIQVGGGDPVAWCRKLRQRLPLLHLKDCVGTANNGPMWCEVGKGNLDFERICREADLSGCEWFIVEQDSTPGDPIDSLKQSYEFLLPLCE